MEEEMESRRVQETFPHSHRRKQAEKPMSLEAQISLYSFLFSGKWTRWGWGEEARKKRGGHSWGSGEGTGLASCPQLSHTHTHTRFKITWLMKCRVTLKKTLTSWFCFLYQPRITFLPFAGRRSRFKSHWHMWTFVLRKAWVSRFFQSASYLLLSHFIDGKLSR